MSVAIQRLTLGAIATNAYLVADTATGDALLIDPVDEADVILQAAEAAGWTIRLILATHAHFDHILAADDLKRATGAPFALHPDGQPLLDNLPQTGLMYFGQPLPPAATPDRWLTTEPETITLGALRLETRYTPGHAPGHISFVMPSEGLVFSGDALFAGSIGRTDLPGGDYPRLMRSITEQLLPLGDAVRVLPGHGDETTIGRERRTNPFVLEYLHSRPGSV
jgi:glyoxylase-like metal-dependent hydrolase (beta-lactamase superfamily II)